NVVGADSEGNAIVTDLSNGNELTIPSRKRLFGVAFIAKPDSADSTYLLTGDLAGVVGLWSISGPKAVETSRAALLPSSVDLMEISWSMKLDPAECQALRGMQIPLFEKIDRLTKEQQTTQIPLFESIARLISEKISGSSKGEQTDSCNFLYLGK